MDLALLVYGISLLNPFTHLFGFAAAILGAVTAFCFVNMIVWATDGEYSWNLDIQGNLLPRIASWRSSVRRLPKWTLPFGILFLLIAIALPSERTAYTMVGAYAAQRVVENPQTQEISSKVLKIINQKLDSFIEDGTKKAGEKIGEVEKSVKETVSQKVDEVIKEKTK